MILECPECGTRYLLADTAIGPDGRQVRCARCGRGWHASTKRINMGTPLASLPPGRALAFPVGLSPEPRSEWSFPGLQETVDSLRQLIGGTVPSYETGFRPRRNPARVLNWLAAGCCTLLLIATGAMLAMGENAPPMPRLFDREAPAAVAAVAAPPLRISLLTPPSLTMMASGSTLFAVSGRVENPTSGRAPVPDIVADLRDGAGRPIYSWTIHTPRSVLAPGESVDFDTSQLDVPADVKSLRLGFQHRTAIDQPL
jgi:predicted Zn finger-like uncharacterized protein